MTSGEMAAHTHTCRAWSLGLAAFWLHAAGCILDDARCGPHQIEKSGALSVCVCDVGSVPDGEHCRPCGENEQASNEQCVCMEGFSRTSADGRCEKSSIGAACSAAETCAEPYPYCVMESGDQGYCTSTGCEDNASCSGGWTCESDGATRFCKKLPSGFGQACDSAADCAGTEATYCETFAQHQCLIENCATGETTCPNEWGCCDYSALIGASFCVPPEQLMDGACPQGGKLVRP